MAAARAHGPLGPERGRTARANATRARADGLVREREPRREQLREGLACALIAIGKMERGERPEASTLACAVAAARERDTLEQARLGCGVLFEAGLRGPYDANEAGLHEGLVGALRVIAALARREAAPLEHLRVAVETALAEKVLEIDQVETALTRTACGEAFARRATEHAHDEARREGKRRETLAGKPRPWVERYERERLARWLGNADPTPRARAADDEGPGLAQGSAQAILDTHEAIEAAERKALRESDVGGGTNPAQAGARTAGEDRYTRRARLERLRWRLRDAQALREQGREREAWQIAAATRHRVATAERANERLLERARAARIPPDER